PGRVVLEFVRRDALAAVIPALPIPAVPDLRALPVGRCEDGTVFTIRLHGTHLLIAGSTGAGKGSYLWGLVRALLPAMAAGLVQDPRKEVLNIRNLFPDKIALRLDEAAQVDLVLGDGAHDRGARCEDIPANPSTGAGIGFMRLEASPDPVRVRAAFVSDADIQAMTAIGTRPHAFG